MLVLEHLAICSSILLFHHLLSCLCSLPFTLHTITALDIPLSFLNRQAAGVEREADHLTGNPSTPAWSSVAPNYAGWLAKGGPHRGEGGRGGRDKVVVVVPL
jgi:hypothetical protein